MKVKIKAKLNMMGRSAYITIPKAIIVGLALEKDDILEIGRAHV